MLTAPLSRRAFVAGAAAAGLALAGCSSAEESVPAPEPAVPAAVAASGVAGALTAAVAYEGADCSPVGCSDALFVAAGWHVFEGLYELDLHTYRAEPGLAADVPVQLTELEYEVTLRENPMFSDGAPVTVEDVCNAFRLNMASDLYGPFLSFISAVTAKDASTVRITLNSPMGILLKERLALVRVFPAASTPEMLSSLPIGSGPWRYETIDGLDGGTVAFVPNENYTGSWPATCRRMEWRVMLDDEARTQALESREVLCMEAAPEVLAERIEEAGAALDFVPGLNLPFLMFNCLKEPFSDARVRQALLYAVDVDSMIANVLNGHGRACTSLLPDYFRGYHRASTVYSYDPERARALLAEVLAEAEPEALAAPAAAEPEAPVEPAGAEAEALGAPADAEAEEEPAGLSLVLRCNDNWVAPLAKQLVADWKAVGVTATVQLMPTEELFADLSDEAASAVEPLPFDVVLSPGDPSCFGNDPDLIMSWWYGDNVWTRGRTCWSRSPEFASLKSLMERARAAEDEGEQQELWNQCFDLIAAEAPLYPLFHRETATAYYAANLDDYDPIAATGLLFLGTTPMEEVTTL